MPVLINGMKVRGMMDTGATHPLISKGLVKLLGLQNQMHPTSAVFSSVGAPVREFVGKLHDLPIVLSDMLSTNITLPVVDSDEPKLILGNEVIGGLSSLF